MRKCKVTVVLPVYNGMPFLPEAVDSILAQTLKSFRLLVIDDGSTDDSADYLETLKDPRVTLIHQENRGLGATLNRGIELCETKYLARMDADDVALPERLERQLAFMEAHPEVVVLGTQIAFLCDKNTVRHDGVPLDHNSILHALTRGRVGSMCHPTVMCRADAARRVGGYRVPGLGEELDFFLRMSEIGRIANLCDVLLHYRINSTSVVMTRWPEVRLGHAFAIHSAGIRRRGRMDVSFDEFSIQWEKLHFLHAIASWVSAWGVGHYRKAIWAKAQRKPLQAAIHLSLAAVVNPRRVLERCGNILRKDIMSV